MIVFIIAIVKLIYNVQISIRPTFFLNIGSHKNGHLETSITEFSRLYAPFVQLGKCHLLISLYPSSKTFDFLVIN